MNESQTLYVLLGRIGDILALLPCLKADADRGDRPALMVAKEYAPILDGVSYVDPVIFDGKPEEVERAVTLAGTLRRNVVCCQVAGPKAAIDKHTYKGGFAMCDAFDKEIWRTSGHVENISNPKPLVFDRRSPERETALAEQCIKPRKKNILVALGGYTSPFPAKDLLLDYLRLKYTAAKGFAVVDISELHAERIYDLLGLYERAYCLVASDSAPLHLAQAVPGLPVIALVRDTPTLWHGSSWKRNHAVYVRYGDFGERATDITDAIAAIGRPPFPEGSDLLVYHTYLNGAKGPESMPDLEAFPVRSKMLGRDTVEVLKDDRRLPYLRDVLRLACQKAADDDAWLYLVHPNATLKARPPREMGWCHRTVVTDDREEYNPAIDLFAFQKKWWLTNRHGMPDFVMGNDLGWQQVLAKMIEMDGGKEFRDLVYSPPPAPLTPYVKVPPRLTHNAALTKDWTKAHSVSFAVPPVSAQVETVPLQRERLFRNGYNCAIIDHGDKLLLAYRYHEGDKIPTKLALAHITDDGKVKSNDALHLGERGYDDPRFFKSGNDDIWMSWVETDWPVSPVCTVRYGMLKELHVAEAIRPSYGLNDGKHMEKNWVFFSHQGRLFFLYGSWPKQIVVEWSGAGTLVAEHFSTGVRWPYGDVHGDTTPIPYEGKLLRFFHSRLDNQPHPTPHRYYIGACLMNPEPPFETVAVSRKPIIVGTENDGLTPEQRKAVTGYFPGVVFPLGAVQRKDHWLLSLGVNHCQCVLAKIYPKDLHL